MPQSLDNLSTNWTSTATLTGIKFNVATDTGPSNAASNLMDLQVGGASRFSVSKDGKITLADGAFTSPTLGFSGNSAASGFYRLATNGFAWGVNGNAWFRVRQEDFGIMRDGVPLVFGTATDLFVHRDAANTLAQRNGTNAQAFRIYNTFTDASNYERGVLQWSANVFEVGVDAAGSGTPRELYLRTANIFTLAVGGSFILHAPTASRLSLKNDVHLQWTSTANAKGTPDTGLLRNAAAVVQVTNGSTGGGAMQLAEMTAPAAPAANSVRIYAEDDGAGKTRLMALFATGAAQQLAIEP